MRPFTADDLQGVRWLPRESAHPDFDLLAGNDPIGRLTWTAGRSSLATGEMATGKWTFKRLGFLNPKVLVRDVATGKDLARLSLHWRSSDLDFGRGRVYRLLHKGRLIPAWEFRDASGMSVLHVEAVREQSKLAGGLATVPSAAASNPDIAVLVLLSWYFVVMEWAEEEAEAVTDSTLVAWSG